MLNLLSQTNVLAKIELIENESLVSRARNTMASRFLKSTHPVTSKPIQWLLFIDTDIEFAAWHVARLVRTGLALKDQIVCGMYPLKSTKPQFVCTPLPGKMIDGNGWVDVREGGTGFMLIHRSVFEKMAAQYPEIAYTCDSSESELETRWDFFAVGPYYDKVQKTTRYLSEDYYFCQRWRDIGGRVVMDTQIRAKHHGNQTFPIPQQDIAAAAEEYRRAAELVDAKAKT
jgi:hypothetical protein